MKKSIIVTLCNFVLVCCIVACLLLVHPYSSNIEAATFNQLTSLDELELMTQTLSSDLKKIENNMASYEETLSGFTQRLDEIAENQETLENLLVDYYISELSNPNYYSIYNEDYIYYTAAESLGQIGKPAIPPLIEKLSTTDDYERALVLYALLLASQADDVKAFAGDDYIQTYLDFDSRNHPAQVELALKWWEKYKNHF